MYLTEPLDRSSLLALVVNEACFMPDKRMLPAVDSSANGAFPESELESDVSMLKPLVKPRTLEETEQLVGAMTSSRRSFTEVLLSMPDVGEDEDFERCQGSARNTLFDPND